MTPRLGPRFRVTSGRRPCGPAPVRDLRDAAPSLRLGRVTRGWRCGRLIRVEAAQEVQVPQPPLGVDGHLLPEPVKLARKQRSPQGQRTPYARGPEAGEGGVLPRRVPGSGQVEKKIEK